MKILQIIISKDKNSDSCQNHNDLKEPRLKNVEYMIIFVFFLAYNMTLSSRFVEHCCLKNVLI